HDKLLQLRRQARLVAQVGPQGFQSLRHLGHVQEKSVGTDVGPPRTARHERVVRGLFVRGDLLSGDEWYAGHEPSSGWRSNRLWNAPEPSFKVGDTNDAVHRIRCTTCSHRESSTGIHRNPPQLFT